jgi:hypothetical protein
MEKRKDTTLAVRKDLAIKVKAHCAITGQTMLDWLDKVLIKAMEQEKSPLLEFLKNNPTYH